MFKNRKISIITIERKHINLSLVDPSKRKIVKEINKEWTPGDENTIKKTTDFLIKEIGKEKARILLGSDSYYLVKLPYTKEITREEILKTISGRIPEILDEHSWDYRKEGEDSKEEIIAFAPVKNIYEQIVLPLVESEIQIEATEPEEIAKKRDNNPVIGLALKKDISGKDEDVLNIDTAKKVVTKTQDNKIRQESTLQENAKKYGRNILLVGITITLFLMAGLILKKYLTSTKEKTNLMEAPSGNTETSTEKKENTTLVTEEVDMEKLKKETSILILNGTGTPGEANNVKGILEKAGFENIKTEDADNSNYEKTKILFKENTENAILTSIKEALEKNFSLELSEEFLGTDMENSIVLIIGQRKS
jgi:hypothetical protein